MSIQRIANAYLADTARVTGEVTLGDDVNLWYNAVVRGDVAPVIIGRGTNVQDNAVVHCDKGFANEIGCDVIIGHGALVHGVFVGDGSMIGMGATVLGGSRIGKGCIVAAGAVVPQGLDVPDGMVVMGVPGRVLRPTREAEQAYLRTIPQRYVELARHYANHPDDTLTRPWRGNV